MPTAPCSSSSAAPPSPPCPPALLRPKTHLNSSNPHSSTSQSPECALCSRSRGLCSSSTGRSELDMESGDTNLLASCSDILSCQHCCVGGRLVPVGLDLHSSSDSRDCLLAREIRYVNEGVVERGKDVSDACESMRSAAILRVQRILQRLTEDELALTDLRSQADVLLGHRRLCSCETSIVSISCSSSSSCCGISRPYSTSASHDAFTGSRDRLKHRLTFFGGLKTQRISISS